MDGWISGWMDGWMDESVNGWMDGQMDRVERVVHSGDYSSHRNSSY